MRRALLGLVGVLLLVSPAWADDLTTNLVSYWKLDEESGTREDIHGSNDLTDNNTVLYGTGKLSNAADFEAGNSEYFSKANAYTSGLSITSGDYTVAVWLKPESIPSSGSHYYICGAEWDWMLRYQNNSGTLRFQLQREVAGVWVYHSVNYTMSAGTWYHVAMVWHYASHTFEVFVNGASAGSDSSGSTASHRNLGGPFYIARTYYQDYFDGLMDEMGFWSSALTESEAAALYNSGGGLAYPFTSASVRRRVVIF